MRDNPREILNHILKGYEDMGKWDTELMRAEMGFLRAVEKPGALDSKVKNLISVAISVSHDCYDCIVFHTNEAFKAGATRDELKEAGFIGAFFGGSPAQSHPMMLLKETIETLASDHGK